MTTAVQRGLRFDLKGQQSHCAGSLLVGCGVGDEGRDLSRGTNRRAPGCGGKSGAQDLTAREDHGLIPDSRGGALVTQMRKVVSMVNFDLTQSWGQKEGSGARHD